jgi:DNA-binding NarL/FixJ family response regulator
MASTSEDVIRVGIIHRHRLLRDSLSCYLSQREAISVVYAASGWELDEREMAALNAQVLLLECDQASRAPMQAAKQLHASAPETKIVMMDVPDREADILSCIEDTGASGYLLRDASAEDVLRTVEALAKGETLCSPRIAHLLFSRVSSLAHRDGGLGLDDETGLTRREREIIGLIERGLCNKEIAVHLCIEVQTVKNHVHNILDKLQLQDRREAARYARERGLVGRGSPHYS